MHVLFMHRIAPNVPGIGRRTIYLKYIGQGSGGDGDKAGSRACRIVETMPES